MNLNSLNIANNFAKALSDLNLEEKIILENLDQISKTINSSKDLQDFYANPTIESNIKLKVTEDIFKSKINDNVYEFLTVLVEKNKVNILNSIYEQVVSKLDKKNNIQYVQITSATDLNDEYKSKIIYALKTKLNKEIKPKWFVDTSIIAGLIVKIDDTVIDTSLKNKLENLSKNIR